jgi:hypothetical protein
MIHQVHPNKIRQILFISILILLAYVIGKETYFLLGAFLGAVTVYILLLNPLNKLTGKYHWNKYVATLFLMLLSLIAIVIPSGWVVMIAIEKLTPVIQNPQIINDSFQTIHTYLMAKFHLNILNESNVAKWSGQIMPAVQKSIGSTVSGLGNLAMMYVILFFMLTSDNDLELWLRKNAPLKNSNAKKVISEFRSLVYSNALGIPIVALLQGTVALIGYWIFGVNEFILMGLLTAVCSVMPVVGSMAVYVPLAIYLMASDHPMQGLGVLFWGLILIGSVDNIARFMLQKKIANVHPMITIFGVIIGMNMFGFLGIIFGPLLLSMFMLLVKVYIDEYGHTDPVQSEFDQE